MNIKFERHGLVLFFAVGFSFIHDLAIGDELHVPSQFQTIQSAIDAAADNDEIIVAGGHYAEAIDFQGKLIVVRSSDGAGSAVLDASGLQSPAVTMIDVPSGAALKGFTIRGGTGVPLKFNSIGGGAYVLNSSARFEDCVFRDTKIFGSGGAAYIDGGSVQFVSCSFFDNSATFDGGGIFARAATITIAQCVFQRNQARYGAAIRLLRSVAMVTGSLIVANGGGTDGGGGIHATLTNYTIQECIIADNTAFFGRGVSGDSCTLHVQNTVIWGPHNGQIAHEDSDVSIERSNIRACGGSGAGWFDLLGNDLGGNLDTDPLFRDLLGPDGVPRSGDEDYTLKPNSPCIDAGANAHVAADAFDLDGDGDTTEPIPFDLRGLPRFIDDPGTPDTGAGTAPIVDIGAYEFQGVSVLSDINDDGDVNGADLGTLLASWGPCAEGAACRADLNGDGAVNAIDLTILMKSWN